MTYYEQYPQYFDSIKEALREWNEYFKDYDINDYLYEEQENVVYGVVEKLQTRIRSMRKAVPKEIKMKLPSLRTLLNTYMVGDSDMHLSDYEYVITDVLRRTYKMRNQNVKTTTSASC